MMAESKQDKTPPSSSFIARIAAALNSRLHKTREGFLHDSHNPLWNITSNQVRMMYDLARRGNFSQLQYLYNEVENCDPTFLVCVTRRCGAISELGWKVVRSDERANSNADEGLVKEQREYLESVISRIDNLPEAFEHLALSAFRGYSVLNIWRDANDMPTHLECLDHWNILLNRKEGAWLWNGDGTPYIDPEMNSNKLIRLNFDDNIIIQRKRQIDWPALKIFLRLSIGERDWGRCLETYGLPPVIITMPEFTSKQEEKEYKEASASIFEGRSGVIPYGSQVNFATEARGTNPFSEFIEHQMKLYVLLSTGGTLTSLSEAGSGTLAGNAQMEVWKQIVRSDIQLISNALNKQLCSGLISSCKDFKGKPNLVEFKLDTTPKMTAAEIVSLVSNLSNSGYEMDIKDIERVLGFPLKKKSEALGFNSDRPHKSPLESNDNILPTVSNQSILPDTTPIQSLPPIDEKGAKNGLAPQVEKPKSSQTGEKGNNVDEWDDKIREAGELVEALRDDFKDVADRVSAILALPEEQQAEAARKLIDDLEKLVPEDPAMASVIAEQMQEVFDKQTQK